MKNSITKAVIPVAGIGTRCLPATKAVPKELLPIVDKPIIQYIVEEAVASGITDIIFISSQNKNAIERYFSPDATLEKLLRTKGKMEELATVESLSHLANFHYINQAEPLGLGHAVLLAEDMLDSEPFLVFGGDDVIASERPVAAQLIDAYSQCHGTVVGVIPVDAEQTRRYGIIDPGEMIAPNLQRVKNILEKPHPDTAPSQLGVGGRWLLTPEIFDALRATTPDESSELQLTDALQILINTQPVFAKTYEGTYYDCGNKIEYLKAVISFALKRNDVGPAISTYIQSLKITK